MVKLHRRATISTRFQPPNQRQTGDMCWFPERGVPQNGGFIMEFPMKKDDWAVSYFRKPPYMLFEYESNLGAPILRRPVLKIDNLKYRWFLGSFILTYSHGNLAKLWNEESAESPAWYLRGIFKLHCPQSSTHHTMACEWVLFTQAFSHNSSTNSMIPIYSNTLQLSSGSDVQPVG